jgi:hypothetical protein
VFVLDELNSGTLELISRKNLEYEKNLNCLFPVKTPSRKLYIYSRSITRFTGGHVFVGRIDGVRYLGLLSSGNSNLFKDLEGKICGNDGNSESSLKVCPLSPLNARLIRETFPFTSPKHLGIRSSFGLGDRLGLAGPAHIRAVRRTAFKPVLAQQSIRELDRTERSPREVLDSVTWSVLQEGYQNGFGADGDHLKTPSDIDRVVPIGFTMITIDPSDHVDEPGEPTPNPTQDERKARRLPWSILDDTYDTCLRRYEMKAIRFGSGYELNPNRDEILRALRKYGRVIAHTSQMVRHLRQKYPALEVEIELSVDETESVTSPFEHFYIVNELKRLGIQLISMAPRFPGRFEKGIDYFGNEEELKTVFLAHRAIARHLGPYKIGIHSGSDKFSLYRLIGSLPETAVHIKTAGTSYLEALKAVCQVDPSLVRQIALYSLSNYKAAKASYHVSADESRVPDLEKLKDVQLASMIGSQEDFRQILHVNFGGVLTARDTDGSYRFRDHLLDLLDRNEALHFRLVEQHFRKHFESFTHPVPN